MPRQRPPSRLDSFQVAVGAPADFSSRVIFTTDGKAYIRLEELLNRETDPLPK